MDDIVSLLKSDPEKAVSILTTDKREPVKILNLRKEFHDLCRDQRETQIGKIQKDKTVGEGDKRKVVKGVRIPIPLQNKIVTTATAFEFGEPVTINAEGEANKDKDGKLADEVFRLWQNNRIDAVIQKLKILQKSELQSALLFYIQDIKPNTTWNKILGTNKNKDIKVKVLENKNGTMTPYFDSFGHMKYFTWEFETKDQNKKEIRNVWVYDEKKVYKLNNSNGALKLESEPEEHGFGKIPVVYLSQEHSEWYNAQTMIDRLEVSLSKLGASNDYTGHPILKLYGDVQGAPEKDVDGKAFFLEQKITQDGKQISADVDFLTYDQAPEAVKLEQDRLEKYIYSLTSTPDISFDNVKGLGNVSGVALKLMFLDAMIKAKMNEGENRTIVERILNIFIAGTVTTTNTNLSNEAKGTYFTVKFNSILPDDLKETIETYSTAVQSKIMSTKTAIENLGVAVDVDQEMEDIKSDNVESSNVPTIE